MAATDTSLQLAFYGDDFTGSTDALEVLAFAGWRCALFLEVPGAQALRELGPFDAIGIAGSSRSMSPREMDAHLPAVLSALAALPVPLVHYKVCSTFDSAPHVGSIGHAMDLARAAFGAGPIPVVAATPALARYCVFGNLFARSATDGRVHRLDRHPIMSAHPVTPMAESDLALHLGRQTTQSVGGFTLPGFAQPTEARDAELDRIVASGADAIVFDGTAPEHLTDVGRMLERLSRGRPRPLFAVGSSGLEYAVTQWRASSRGAAADTSHYDRFGPAAQVLAISGSASALSRAQIDAAVAAGFLDIAVDAAALVAEAGWQDHGDALAQRAIAALREGRSVMMHSARGPADERIDAAIAPLVAQGLERERARLEAGRRLAQRIGRVAEAILRAVPLQRLLLSGGDTSSLIAQQLAPQALQVAARLAPGAPLCRVVSRAPHLRSLEIALKGGQMGPPDFFVKALRGTA